MSDQQHTKESAEPIYPLCKTCGWRMGGIDSWNGLACKCGKMSSPIDLSGVK